MTRIKKTFRYFITHELVSGSFYIMLGTTFSSFLAFILNIFFARQLSYEDYGILASLLSLVILLTIPSQSLTAIIVRYSTIFFARGEKERAGAFYVNIFKKLIIFSLVLNLFFLFSYPVISNFLKIKDPYLFFLSGIAIASFYFAILNIAFLQSLLKFKLIGLIYSIAGIGKLLSGMVLVLLGFKVFGALLATLIFSIIDFVFSLFPLKSIIYKAGKNVNLGTKEFGAYSIPTAVALISLSSFISSDVLLVKHFFSPTDAGLYSGVSLIGKVIFYFTGPVPIAMFPLIVKKHASKEKFQGVFYLSLIIVLTSSLLITAFYFLFPEFTIKLFLGREGYLSLSQYLGLFGIFLSIYSLDNVFVNFFLSIKKVRSSFIVLFFAILQVILIYRFHDNFYQIIVVSIVTSLLLLASLILYYLKVYGEVFSKK